jgi:diphthamide synthase subunit DPH2
MNKKFTNKEYRKVWSKVDRYFTWERRTIAQTYCAFHSEDTMVYIGKPNKHWMYLNIERYGDESISIDIKATSFKDIKQFINIVKLIG